MIILIVRRLMETTELYVRTSELTNENEQQEVVPSQNQEKKEARLCSTTRNLKRD